MGRPFYAAGFVFYNDDHDIWALQYSATERGFVGDPVFVASGLRVVGASEDGSLLAVSTRGMDARSRELTWIDHAGNDLGPVSSLPEGDAPITSPSMARNGRLAYVDGTRIWTLDPRGAQRPIPVSEGVQADPAWSPDGRTLYFSEREPGLSNWAASVKRLDLESGEVSVMTDPGYGTSASADGRWLTYQKGDGGSRSLHYIDLTDPELRPRDFDHGFDEEASLRLSPIQNVAAFIARENTGPGGTLWLDRFPGGGETVLVATDVFGAWTGWSADGTRLYYVHDNTLMGVEVRYSPDGPVVASDPVALFSLGAFGILPGDLDVGADPTRFLAGGRGGAFRLSLPSSLVLIQNWAPGR